jgi:hypothetical protein
MKYPLLAMVVAFPLGASVIADTPTTVLLGAGDSLIFEVPTSSFTFNAERFGVGPYVSSISFTLVTAPLAGPPSLSAWLDTVPVAGPLRFSSGTYSSSQYVGPVSVIHGELSLTPALSVEILDAGSVELVLRNDGPDLLLGLPPNTLNQDLTLSMAGGPLMVGVQSAAVGLQTVPEPGTLPGALAAFGVCCATVVLRRRMSY